MTFVCRSIFLSLTFSHTLLLKWIIDFSFKLVFLFVSVLNMNTYHFFTGSLSKQFFLKSANPWAYVIVSWASKCSLSIQPLILFHLIEFLFSSLPVALILYHFHLSPSLLSPSLPVKQNTYKCKLLINVTFFYCFQNFSALKDIQYTRNIVEIKSWFWTEVKGQ